MTGFSDYDNFDGLGLGELVLSGQVSAIELLDEAIERTERVNDELNAIVYKYYDQARAAIAQGVPQGPFCGVPFLLKDLHLFARGMVSSNGSAAWRAEVANHDSTLVQRYKQAGLVIYGKTNSPELGLNPVTEPLAFGATRNPWNLNRTPGGSSGGAAAAVASGILPLAHASDGGGSIRIPASCCGLVGLKPSRGRVPVGPDKAEGWAGQSTSHIVSRSVRDTAAMLDATAGPEPGEAYSAPYHAGTFFDAAGAMPRPLKIAVSHDKWGQGAYQPEVLQGLDNTIALLQSLGHQLEEARPQFDGELASTSMFTVITVNVALALRQRAQQLGCSVENLDVEEGTRFMMAMGDGISGADYAEAIQNNQRLGRLFGEFHQQYDVLLAPTLSRSPIPIGFLSEAPEQEYADRLFGYMGDTGLYNQTGQPSISLPLHWSEDNLPVGMMFTAAYGNDALLLQLATQLEQASPWWDRKPPLYSGR